MNAAQLQDAIVLFNYFKTAKYENGHLTVKDGETVISFHALGKLSATNGAMKCLGHFFGPGIEEEVKYNIDFSNGNLPNITLLTNVKDQAKILTFLESEISKFAKKYAKKKSGGSSKHMKGFYLWSEPQGIPGTKTFNRAITEGKASKGLMDSCKQIKISMRHYGQK